MSRSQPPLPPDVRALLDHEREIQPLPATVRARALARAHAAVVAGGRAAAPTPAPRTRWAAAAVFCLLSVAVGASAYQIRAHLATPPSQPPAPTPVPPPPSVRSAPIAQVVPEAPGPAPTPPALSRADAARAELRLLRQARAAVAREDYAAALRPIAEHTRQFKGGRLTEEREALRVKALAGLGRGEDARRAASAFRARFPRSVLLPAVNQMSPSGR